MTTLEQADAAIRAASDFLAQRQAADHLWRDFRTRAGEGCDWVTGFVVFATGSAGVLREAVQASTRALVRRQTATGGWSYNNRVVPPDCDSTAWVLLSLSTTTVWKPSSILRGLSYVLRHGGSGGFSTYAPEDGIEHFIGVEPHQMTGWWSPHVCTTAAAILALLLHGLSPNDLRIRGGLTLLRNTRTKDGLWTSYWWPGRHYPTALSLRAFAAAGELTADLWEPARAGLLRSQQADGGFGNDGGESRAFDTSMALTALLTRPDPTSDSFIDAAAMWLVLKQDSVDGGWPTVPVLRIPAPMLVDPPVTGWQPNGLVTGALVRDQQRVFTTAAALCALATWRTAASMRPFRS